jgi:hypothetical protein
MITKRAIVLAIILGTASGSLLTTRQYSINAAYDMYGNDRDRNSESPTFSKQSSAGRSPLAPTFVAQGRCFNGHCY